MTLAANKLIEEGANSVKAICTHPVLSGKAYEKIENSQLTELIVSDTIPLKSELSKIKVISCAHLFADAIRYVNENRSIQSLFFEINFNFILEMYKTFCRIYLKINIGIMFDIMIKKVNGFNIN